MNQNSLSKTILKSVGDSSLIDAGIDIAEVGVDIFLDDGFIKDLPIIGTLAKVAGAVLTIPDKLFLRKVAKFLFSIHSLTEEEIETFQSELESDSSLQEKLGSNILFLLDRYDHDEKPIILGKLFQLYIKKTISFEQLSRAATGVDRAFIEDLRSISVEPIYDQTLINLLPSGLSSFDVGQNFGNSGQVSYYLTRIGEIIKNAMSS